MKRTFYFKVREGRFKNPVCPYELEIELEERKDGRYVFHVRGKTYSPNKRGIMRWCHPSNYPELKGQPLSSFLVEMEKYHLNDLCAGTPEQEKCLKEHEEMCRLHEVVYGDDHYTACCETLKEYGLYEVDLDGKPYKYGHAWLYRPIPDEDLAKIRYVLDPSHSEEDIEEWLKEH